mmetsp:Transcript_51195/g.124117  ORF Transcript_51195/g.124117 Transcript_51195/m.124117 type:complete len:557 (-) Transcript_51195:62-1732(-)
MVHMATQAAAERAAVEMEPLKGEGDAGDDSPRSSGTPHKQLPPLKPAYKLDMVALSVLVLLGIWWGPWGEMQLDGLPIPAARRTLGMLMCVSTLWATEAVPLYITSLLIPLLTVMSGSLLPPSVDCKAGDTVCLTKRYTPYPPGVAAKEVCGQFFDPTVLLFMAGFSIGSVLEKQRISNLIASLLLRPFGNKPENVLLGVMSLGCFLSMWISNVPSSVLCVSISLPIIHQLPAGDPYAKALLLGIAFSNNIGGMTTPIASPQNVIAFAACEQVGCGLTFTSWMMFSLPFCGLLLLATWALLRYRYPPQMHVLRLTDLTRDQPSLKGSQIMALSITVGTVVAWALWKPLQLEPLFGSMGVVGLVPVILFFSTGLLEREDFEKGLNWTVLVLIGGGLALGHVMERSYLLHIASSSIVTALSGAGLWTFMGAFALLMAIVANFISSTVAAIIIIPVVAQVGKRLAMPRAMVVASVIMDSAAMGLPVSSFPNANSFGVKRAAAAEDDEEAARVVEKGKKAIPGNGGSVLEVRDYMVTGGMVTAMALVECMSLGYTMLILS